VNGKRNGGDKKKRPMGGGGNDKKSRPPEQTFEEVRYLKHLIENRIPIRVRLRNNEEVSGTIEYYDHSFIRLTREPEPNLFIFKHEIKYLYEIE
jgi:host factor-I protein